MSGKIEPIISSLGRGECIALDAEFTGRSEMLELAVADITLETLFESLFTPARSRRWSRVPHGITPAMVKGAPKFAWRVQRVQRVIDRCRYLVGFALENDIARLKAERVVRLETKRVLDLRDWFWLIYGRHHGFDYREGVGLASICAELQIDDDSGEAHRAGYDTRCTLLCFRLLLERFAERHSLLDAPFDRVVAEFDREFDAAMAEYRRLAAAGFLSMVVTDEGSVIIKANRERPEGEGVVESVAVADRRDALARLSREITGRVRPGRIILNAVTPEALERLRAVAVEL